MLPRDRELTAVILQPGTLVFERFTLTAFLGEGGMGVVWLGRDGKLGRDVALKFLPDLVRRDPESLRDLKNETRRCLDLTHPNIVRVYDLMEDERAAACAMEYVPGRSLSARKAARPSGCFDPADLAPLVTQLCGALEYAHEQAKIVHRDLKPANLLVTDGGVLKIADFGIARSLHETQTRLTRDLRGSSGTLAFMGPQQLLNKRVEPADDIYSLGATLYDLLTGKAPFYAGDLVTQIREESVPPIAARREELGNSGAAIPPMWEETILACLSKRVEDRPRSAGEVARRLTANGDNTIKVPPEAVKRFQEPGSVAHVPSGDTTRPFRVEKLEEDVAAAQKDNAKKEPPARSAGWFRVAVVAAAIALLVFAGWRATSLQRGKAEALRLQRQREEIIAATRPAEPPEQQGRDAILARIAAAADGTPRAALEAAGTAVQDYLATAPQSRKAEVAAAWAKRQADWESARQAAAQGSLVVKTSPADAEVRVAGLAPGHGPTAMLKELKVGRHTVVVSAPGYDEWRGEADVKESETASLNVVLARSKGQLTVETEPAGLEFTLAGDNHQETGRADGRARTLPVGRYTLTVSRPGFPDTEKTIDIARGASVRESVVKVGGTLELNSTPQGAEVWQNGKRLGTTPYRREEIAPGTHGFRLILKGYKETGASVAVGARQVGRETVILEKLGPPDVAPPPVARAAPTSPYDFFPPAATTVTPPAPTLGRGGSTQLVLAETALQAGRLAEARGMFTAAAQRDPESVAAFLGIGRCANFEGDLGGAITAYLNVARLAPETLNLRAWLAEIFIAQGRFRSAEQWLDTELKMKPDSAWAWSWRGTLQLANGDRAAAAASWARAKALQSEIGAFRYQNGSALLGYNQPKRAMLDFTAALMLNPQGTGAYFQLAECHARLGEREKAIENFRLYLRSDATSEWAARARQRLDELSRSR